MERKKSLELFRYNRLIQDALHRLWFHNQLSRNRMPYAGPYKGKLGCVNIYVVQLYNVHKPDIEKLYEKCRRTKILRSGPLTGYQERTYKKMFDQMILNLYNDWWDVYKWFGVPCESLLDFVGFDSFSQLDLLGQTEDISVITVRERIFSYLDNMPDIDPEDYNAINFTIDMIQQIVKSSLYLYNAFYYWVEPRKTKKEMLNDARRIKQLECN